MVTGMWTCPGCGRSFASRNQSHTCAALGDLDRHFARSGPQVRAAFDAALACVRAVGPVQVLEHLGDSEGPTRTLVLSGDDAEETILRAARAGAHGFLGKAGCHTSLGGARAVVAHIEQPPEHRVQAHHVEIRSADHARADLARLAETHHCEADRGKVAECV